MEYLYKYYYNNEQKDYKEEVKKRLSAPSRIEFNFKVKQYKREDKHRLYFIPTLKMIKMVEAIAKRDRLLDKYFDALPDSAREAFEREVITNELFSTNDLEGVKSTKREIAESVKLAKENKKTKKTTRFLSMANSYLSLYLNEIKLPSTPQDIRKIYDKISASEVEEEDKIDGKYFRLDGVDVKTSTGKVIHQGINGHENIIIAIDKMLDILNGYEEISAIIKVAVAHYIFGYIHPFYDGNGRTSRFINSLYLSKSHSRLTSISLSRAINNNSKKYYEIFEHTNSTLNAGELNEFIETFLEYIIKGQEEVKNELVIKLRLIDSAFLKLSSEKKLENKDQKYFDALFIIGQIQLFTDNDLTVQAMASYLEVAEITARKVLNDLVDMGLLEVEGSRPKLYKSIEGYFDFE
ncbi:Fic family protein [Macrococcus equipercicus]|uniref:Fic family protein n=1 Tax=Macrococcus equipercicus TaxID=69967 RepID=A0A9Q9BQS1_9STAP|nr:Fic family protein [Macrococcus equipercicus]KAA1039476.1 Fic family protein [Macrococcus equipercicus]UTH13774.1 Fic family protein [Macrococcus equipercicus]